MKLSTALRLGRVSNLPTTWTNVAAGMTLAAAAFDGATWLGVSVAVSLFYVGGMFLNDAFDAEIDAQERPERPIPSGEVSAPAVFTIGFGLLGAGCLLIGALSFARAGGQGLAPVLAALALGATIVFYDAYHKNNPLSPLVMGAARVLVYLTAALSARSLPPPALAYGGGALLAYLIGLTYIAKQENLRELRGVWPLVFLALPFAVPGVLARPESAAFALSLALWVLYSLRFVFSRTARNIPRAVGQLIAGICLLDAMLVAAYGSAGVALSCAAGVLLTRLLQRYIAGT